LRDVTVAKLVDAYAPILCGSGPDRLPGGTVAKKRHQSW